jgi:hypothetical protein
MVFSMESKRRAFQRTYTLRGSPPGRPASARTSVAGDVVAATAGGDERTWLAESGRISAGRPVPVGDEGVAARDAGAWISPVLQVRGALDGQEATSAGGGKP